MGIGLIACRLAIENKIAKLAYDAEQAFIAEEFPVALNCYDTAIRLEGILKSFDRLSGMAINLYINRAGCYIRLNMIPLAIDDCEICISQWPFSNAAWETQIEIHLQCKVSKR